MYFGKDNIVELVVFWMEYKTLILLVTIKSLQRCTPTVRMFVLYHCNNDLSIVCGVLFAYVDGIPVIDTDLYHRITACNKTKVFAGAE